MHVCTHTYTHCSEGVYACMYRTCMHVCITPPTPHTRQTHTAVCVLPPFRAIAHRSVVPDVLFLFRVPFFDENLASADAHFILVC